MIDSLPTGDRANPPPTPSGIVARWRAWQVLVPLLLAGHGVWIVLLRGGRLLASDSILVGGQIALAALLLCVWALLVTTPAGAITLPPARSRRIIFLGALGLHLLSIIFLWPALSEDVTRYRLDGRTWLEGSSPLAETPTDLRARVPFDAIDRATPFQHLHSAYPPTAQLVFVVARALDRTFPEGQGSWRELLPTLSWSQRVLSFRVIFALAALVATWLLLRLVELNGRSPWWVVLFAWNPLTILETSGMAHVDIVGVALMLGSMLMLARSRAATAGALLAMATMVKPFAIVLLPFMLAGSSRAMRCVIGFLVTVLLVGVPIVQFQGGMSGAYATAETVAARWEANGSYYEWYKSQFGTIDGHFMLKAKADARRNAVAVVCCVAGVMLLAGAPVAAAGYGIFVAMLLVGTTVYPWYLLWPLALAPLARTGGPTLLVWSGTASICYLLWRSNDWTLTPAQRWAEYAPVYAILVLELAWVIKTAARKRLSGLWPGCISDSIKT